MEKKQWGKKIRFAKSSSSLSFQCSPLTRKKCVIITERNRQALHSLEIKSKYFWRNNFPPERTNPLFGWKQKWINGSSFGQIIQVKAERKMPGDSVTNSRGQEIFWSSLHNLNRVSGFLSGCHEEFWHAETWTHRLLNRGKINYSWRRNCIRPKRHFFFFHRVLQVWRQLHCPNLNFPVPPAAWMPYSRVCCVSFSCTKVSGWNSLDERECVARDQESNYCCDPLLELKNLN